jgi:hypothetical protein
MGLSHSPKIVTNGLVFALDAGNDRSYKGPVVTNRLNQITNNDSSGAGKSITSGTQEVFIPQLGTSTVKFSSVQNNYPAVSADCCPSLFAFSSGVTVTPSTLYTYSIVYKVESGYTNPNYMYRYEYTSSVGTYVTEGGVHNDSNRIHLGDGWYWAWGTFTTQATTNWISYSAAFYYRYSTSADRLYIAKVMLVQGDYTQLHPRYWPDVNTARANTSTHVDMIVPSTTITASGLTYANNGSYTFNGSTDVIRVSKNLLSGTSDFTITAIARTTNISSTDYICGNYGLGNNGLEFYFGGSKITLYAVGTYLTGTTTLSSNVWYHLTAVRSAGVATIYINGNFEISGAMTGSIPTTNPFTIGNGHDYTSEAFSGNIPYVKVYDRALSANEIKENFNALRGRYGI